MTKHLFTAEAFADDGGSYVARHWMTTEEDARHYFAKHMIGYGRLRLIGPTGLVLAEKN
jgi:hypothetical protein